MAAPITTQPGAGGYHPSLDKLASMDSFVVDQDFELKRYIPTALVFHQISQDEFEDYKDAKLPEVQTDWSGVNSYGFSNAKGGKLFLAVENHKDESGACCSCSSFTYRRFKFQFLEEATDKSAVPVMEVARPWNVPCLSCCCLTSLQRATITSNGKVLGYVVQPFLGGIFTPKFNILDANRNHTFTVVGSFKTSPTSITVLKIVDTNGNAVGEISRKQKHLSNDMKTDADFFGLRLPGTLDVAGKATLFAALIFVDFVMFEGEGAASTVGNINIDGDGDLRMDVEDRAVTRCGKCDLFCCGCMLRC
eukprot:m.236686 g.236686  ORF g.236686 m.236686 type:complete len:306 (-) comp13011_c0_seq1:119-1036(-)